jgi:acetyltransferase-like isoleucine patch superfamily enzyme
MILAVGSVIEAQERVIDKDIQVGPDVRIKCRSLKIGAGCRIGIQNHVNFRNTTGVHIECDELELGPGTEVGRAVQMYGGKLVFGPRNRIGAGASINVKSELQLGPCSALGLDNTVEGRSVRIGRELWTGPQVRIGGGSCFEVQSSFVAGYWLHLGMRTFINTARPVTIGNEVGIGTDTKVFTHGAYQSALDGYPVNFAPVEIGDNCWIPSAVVNPGVSIGAGAVIGVGSVVTKSLPAGCLAAGVPCKVIREKAFPRQLSTDERKALFVSFFRDAAPILAELLDAPAELTPDGLGVKLPAAEIAFSEPASVSVRAGQCSSDFLLSERRITGRADKLTEKLRDLLRRHGIRFRSEVRDGKYSDWPELSASTPADKPARSTQPSFTSFPSSLIPRPSAL